MLIRKRIIFYCILTILWHHTVLVLSNLNNHILRSLFIYKQKKKQTNIFFLIAEELSCTFIISSWTLGKESSDEMENNNKDSSPGISDSWLLIKIKTFESADIESTERKPT